MNFRWNLSSFLKELKNPGPVGQQTDDVAQ